MKIPISYSFDEHFSPAPVKTPNEERSFRNLDFSKANYSALSADLDEVNWDELKSKCLPNTFYYTFIEKVIDICYKHVPKKRFPNDQKKPNRCANRARKKRKLLARIFSLKSHNPASPKIAILESQYKDMENQKKKDITQMLIRNEQKAISSIRVIQRLSISMQSVLPSLEVALVR